jgi:hypothetical protein
MAFLPSQPAPVPAPAKPAYGGGVPAIETGEPHAVAAGGRPPNIVATSNKPSPFHTADVSGIKEAMALSKSELADCYFGWHELDPKMEGKVAVHFVIVADGALGHIDEVALETDGLKNTAFEGCIVSVIDGMRFLAPADGRLEVTYPLTFASTP